MITRPGFPADNRAYAGQLPPPLCFTVPAGNPRAAGKMLRWAPQPFSPGVPKLEMDPSNPNTWQRQYVFTR